MSQPKRRVVVTGMGCVSPLGNDVNTTWEGILQGRSGVAPITSFDASKFRSQISASVKGLDITQYMEAKEAKKVDNFIQFAIAASTQAMSDAGFQKDGDFHGYDANRVGVAIGAGIGGLLYFEHEHANYLNNGPRKISPSYIPKVIINEAPGVVSMLYGAKGPNISVVSACTTGNHNIGMAARMIVYGDADMMIAGGAEYATCAMGVGGFSAMRALSQRNDDPERASRPWDKDRDGFVLGDGAATLVLEELESAKKRGAKIYAELVGFGMSGDAYHMAAPSPTGEGGAASMLNAMRDAQLNATDIDYINAHGTSTPLGDQLEIKGVKQALGDHAYNLVISSTKSMTGHLLGAAGALEAIFSILAIRDQVAPPTMNLDEPGEGCDLDFAANKPREMKLDVALSNSFGFGGTNGTVIFKKFEG